MHICGMCPKRYISGKNQGTGQCGEFDTSFVNKTCVCIQKDMRREKETYNNVF